MFEFEQESEEARAQSAREHQDVTLCYSVFVTDERAARLLAMWRRQARTTIPIDSSVQAYAAKEFARRFIDLIDEGIERAQNLYAPSAKQAEPDFLS